MVVIESVLSFLTSRIGLAAVALVVGYFAGHNAARQGEEMRNLRSTNATLRTELAVVRAAHEAADAELRALKAWQDGVKGQIDAYAEELANRPADAACRLSDADVKRLRGFQ
jgi:hypothetical protein